MARSLQLVLLACLALAATCLADSSSNALRQDDKKDYDVQPVALMVGDAPPAFDQTWMKDLGWGYTTPRYRSTTRRPRSTTRRPRSTTTSGRDQSFNIGGVYPYDMRLSQTPVYKKASVFQVNSLDFKYTDPAYRRIHCIQVVDMQKNGRNAAVTVQSGGLGQNYVNMKFKSQRGENINYLVVIWGQ